MNKIILGLLILLALPSAFASVGTCSWEYELKPVFFDGQIRYSYLGEMKDNNCEVGCWNGGYWDILTISYPLVMENGYQNEFLLNPNYNEYRFAFMSNQSGAYKIRATLKNLDNGDSCYEEIKLKFDSNNIIPYNLIAQSFYK